MIDTEALPGPEVVVGLEANKLLAAPQLTFATRAPRGRDETFIRRLWGYQRTGKRYADLRSGWLGRRAWEEVEQMRTNRDF